MGKIGNWMRSQFGNPHGFWGGLVGKVMEWSPSNRQRSDWSVGLLDVQPGHRVLEVGYGPGLAIALLAERARDGLVVGIDRSDVMLRQASARNHEAIAQGRVVLQQASMEALPAWEQPFDRILSINNIFFWEDAVAGLQALHDALAPGGQIAVTVQPRAPGSTDETTREKGRELQAQFEEVGFVDVRLKYLAIKPVLVVCALGSRKLEA